MFGTVFVRMSADYLAHDHAVRDRTVHAHR
jgi:hypothetical protein